MWKVIRIDEDGAVRLLYNGTSTTSTGTSAQIGTASYNSKNDDNAYVGYMQPTVTTHTTTKVQAESNDINSPVKTLVDNWYNTNLSTHSSKIDTNAGYCNDRRVDTVDGGIGDTSTTYSARSRITASTKIPTYKCGHESNDLFTYTNGTYGNKKLTYPTGLITSDELAYAGSLYGSYNYQVFTHSGYWYWTQSPSFFSGGLAGVSTLVSISAFSDDNVHFDDGTRLVVSLNSTATVGSGDGTLTSPYVIE